MSDVTTALSLLNDAIFVSLVNTTLQITLLISLIAFIIRIFRIKSAPTRHSLWLFALFAMLLLPILTPFVPQIDFTRLYQQRVADYGLNDRMSLGMEAGNAGDMSIAGGGVSSESAEKSVLSEKTNVSLINPVSIVYFIWCAGALSMLCRTIVVYGKLRKLRRNSSDVESKAALEMLSRLRKKLGIRRAVKLKSSSRVYAPIGLGVFCPTVILPDDIVDGGSIGELEMILAHELAHIKRLDYLVRFLQNVLKVFFFFHPLFHLLKRNLAREREHICDDWVIHVTEHRSRYAECLVDMLERVLHNPVNIPVTIAMAERKQDIPGRIDMIVDHTRKTATKISTKALTVMLIIGCLILPIIGSIGLVRFARARSASNEGRIVFTQELPLGIYVMDADGENKEQLIDRYGTPSWSPDGQKIAFDYYTDDTNRKDIYIMDANGKNRGNLTNMPGMYEETPSWSPDGKKIAFGGNVWEGKNLKSGGIYIIDTDGSDLKKLAEGPWHVYYPDWSPDGQNIAFARQWEVYVIDTDGVKMDRLTFKSNTMAGISWSPDGKKIAFAIFPNTSNCEIYVMDADGRNQVNITNTPDIYEAYPCWSPDGTKMVFCSKNEICVMNADGSNIHQLTNAPALEMWPDWTAFSYAIEPAGKLKSTWGKIKTLLSSH